MLLSLSRCVSSDYPDCRPFISTSFSDVPCGGNLEISAEIAEGMSFLHLHLKLISKNLSSEIAVFVERSIASRINTLLFTKYIMNDDKSYSGISTLTLPRTHVYLYKLHAYNRCMCFHFHRCSSPSACIRSQSYRCLLLSILRITPRSIRGIL